MKVFINVKNVFSKTIMGGAKLKICIHVKDISLCINYVSYSGRIRTLVALATYIVHLLIMDKVKIDKYFLSQRGYLELIFTEMFIE